MSNHELTTQVYGQPAYMANFLWVVPLPGPWTPVWLDLPQLGVDISDISNFGMKNLNFFHVHLLSALYRRQTREPLRRLRPTPTLGCKQFSNDGS